MRPIDKCHKCSTPIGTRTLFGHCPACLMQLGFGTKTLQHTERESSPARRRFGDYELIAQIGRGGMGVVYKAVQLSLNRPVALKMIPAGEMAQPAIIERFHIEAEAAAHLDHPNIVPIFEIGEHGGNHFFSMKLVEGEGLDKMMAEFTVPNPGKAPLQKAVIRQAQCRIARLISTVARAVHYAHEQGILHRDLKPSNILIENGTAHLTDFGLAKIASRSDSVTEPGTIVGTLHYMAPEQALGYKVSTAADIYSLGALLYELLTGRPPFRTDTVTKTLRLLTETEAESPRALNPLVDEDLATIALKCLEKNPQQRYASAADLAHDLDRWQRLEPIRARRATVFVRMHRWARRNPIGAALILTLCVGLGVTGWLLQVVNTQRKKEELALQHAIRQSDINAALVKETASLVSENLNDLWASTHQRYLPIKSEQLANLLPRPIVRITNHAQLVRLHIGLTAHESPVDESRRYAALFEYLENEMSRRLKREVRLDMKLYKFESDRFAAITKGECQILRAGAFPVLKLLEADQPIKPLVQQVNPGKLAVFFTRTNSGIRSLKDLKGRSMAFGETNATISFIAQTKLAALGITGADFTRYDYLDSATEFQEDVLADGIVKAVEKVGKLTSHSEVLEKVIDGTFDAGVSNFRAFQRNQKYGLVEIPETIFENMRNIWIGRRDLKPDVAEAFVGAMTSLRDQGILLTLPDAPTDGYRAVTTDSHANEREAMRRARVLFPLVADDSNNGG